MSLNRQAFAEFKALKDLKEGDWIDISPVITPKLAVFEGDTPFRIERLVDFDAPNEFSLSRVTTTLHLGAHADGPVHYVKGAEGIGERSLLPYIGSAQVIEVKCRRGDRVGVQDLGETKIVAPRVLFKTDSFLDFNQWSSDFMGLTAELIEKLAESGVKLVGIDTPSIDLAQAKNLVAHRAVAKNDLAVLEGLVLRDVLAGVYTLVALPLRIHGGDASPVRAILLK